MMKKNKMSRVKFRDIKNCFFPEYNYQYLGYVYWGENYPEYELLQEFLAKVDKFTRPLWCPKFILNLTHLFGNDNSIVRVRNWTIHRLHNWITGGIMVTDLKWKFGTFRIYGYFPDELDKIAEEYCELIEEKFGHQNEAY